MSGTGSGRVYKRGQTWWIDYHVRGKRKRESSGSKRKKDATALLRRRLAEIGSGTTLGPEAERVTFDDLEEMILANYARKKNRSTKRLRSALKHLRGAFGDLRAIDVTARRIDRYIEERREVAAESTIQKELSALKRMYTLAVQRKRLHAAHVPHIPIGDLDLDNVREDILTDAEVDAICRELDDDLADVVRFASRTGWRKGEIVSLRWGQVDLRGGFIRLPGDKSKNKKPRSFPVDQFPTVRAVLERRLEATRRVEKRDGRIVDLAFHRSGEPIKSMRGAWDGAAKRAGLVFVDRDGNERGPVFHGLRAHAATHFELELRLPRSVSMRLGGWKTPSVFERYIRFDEEKLARQVQRAREEASVIPISTAAER